MEIFHKLALLLMKSCFDKYAKAKQLIELTLSIVSGSHSDSCEQDYFTF